MKHRFLAAAVVLALAAVTALPVLAAPEVDQSKAVIDNADILSADTEDYITRISVSLQESCGAQIGVYTVDYVGNSTMEGYAYEVFNAWGLGDADKDNGVLLLMASGEDDYYIMPGAGIESQLTTSMLRTIVDEQLEPNWVKQDYDAGARDTVDALADRLCRIYGVTLDTAGGSEPAAAQQQGGVGFMGVLLILIAVILVAAVVVSLFRPRGPRGPYDAPPPRRRGFGSGLFWYGLGRASRPRRSPPPPPPRSGGPRPGGFGGAPRSGGFGSTRGGGVGRSGGSFRSGGGGSRGGGVGRR